MATVSFRVPDDVKSQMEEFSEVNWSAILREHIRAELHELESRNLAHAVATSERLSGRIDTDTVAETNTAETIRTFRDGRYGGDRA